MRIGLQIPQFKYPEGSRQISQVLNDIAITAEKANFSDLWVMDHFFQLEGMFGPADDPMLEAYSTLNYLAAITNKIRLGTLVTGVIYRHPGLLVKAVSTLDVLSSGRANLGIGAAWYEKEAKGLGIPFPPIKERFERLEETLQIIKQMWSGNRQPFNGKYYQLAEPINSPQVLSQPHPPILFGGGGEKKTLRLVAKYGDACNLFTYAGIETVKRKLSVLRNHFQDIGRNFNDIEKTVLASVDLTKSSPSDVIKSFKQFSEIGIESIKVNMPNTHEISPIEVFGEEIIPAVAEI